MKEHTADIRSHAFQPGIDEARTLSLSPQTVAQKLHFAHKTGLFIDKRLQKTFFYVKTFCDRVVEKNLGLKSPIG